MKKAETARQYVVTSMVGGKPRQQTVFEISEIYEISLSDAEGLIDSVAGDL